MVTHYFVLLVLAISGVFTMTNINKFIVVDHKRPDSFFCLTDKPTDDGRTLLKERSIEKLCQYNGRGLPGDHVSDCYKDIDETEFACNEKYKLKKYNEIIRDEH